MVDKVILGQVLLRVVSDWKHRYALAAFFTYLSPRDELS